MQKFWKVVRILAVVGLMVLAGVWLTQTQKNRAYDVTRNYAAALIQQGIDAAVAGEYGEDTLFLRSGDGANMGFAVNTPENLAAVKAFVEKMKPIYDLEELSEPEVRCYIVAAGVEIGYMGDHGYLLPTINDDGSVLGFRLTEEQSETLLGIAGWTSEELR